MTRGYEIPFGPSVCVLVLAASLRLALSAAPAGWPIIHQARPLGLVPGRTTALRLEGDNLQGPLALWTSFAGRLGVDPDGEGFQVTTPGDARPGLAAIRFIGTHGVSSLHLVLVDPMPAVPSWRTNRQPLSAQPVSLPGAVDGACEELRSDFYRFTGRKGQRVTVEIVAQRLGSPLDPHLRILELDRRELAATDDTEGLGADSRLEFKCPRSGDYLIEVRDTRYAGGARHRYRLRLGEPLPSLLPLLTKAAMMEPTGSRAALPGVSEREPNDGPEKVQRISWPARIEGTFARPGDRDIFEFMVGRGDRLVVRGRTRSLGSPCDLFLQLQTTNGTKVTEANPSGADEGLLTNRFAEAGPYRLQVEELNRRGGPSLRYQILLQRLAPGFTLGVDTDRLSLPPGGSVDLDVQAQRRDYDGPIRLRLDGLPPVFVVTNGLISAKSNTTRLQITAPADAALGDSFDCNIVGEAAPDGTSVAEPASTLGALHSIFPELRHPPVELDGWITLSVGDSPSAQVTPTDKKKKKK